MARAILVVISDKHGGHRYGLLNPETKLIEEKENGELYPYSPSLNPPQEYLWNEIYLAGIEKVKEIAGKSPIYVLDNGDATQGTKHPDELLSTRMSDHVLIGTANLEPWLSLKNLKAILVAKGTGSHTFGEGSSEILMGQLLRDKRPKLMVDVVQHGLYTINGMQVDFSHHGPHPGTREWTKGNIARYYLKNIMLQSLLPDQPFPRLFIRSHFHEFIEETVLVKRWGKHYRSTIVVTPSLCMLGYYGVQATRSTHEIENGMLIIEIVDGKLLDIASSIKTLDVRTKKVLG